MKAFVGKAALLAGLLACAPALAQTSPVDILIRQAERWLQQDRADLAFSSVERALNAEPRNTAALALAARIEAARNNRAAAAALETRLREAGGTAEQQAEAQGALRGASVDRAAVEEARRLSRDGRANEAAQRWRAIFGAQGPTEAFAQEYFSALAAADASRDEGQRGLQRLADAPNATPRARLAAAQNQTFSPTTRAEGIRRLIPLADHPEVGADARAAWRQALLWQAGDPAARPQIEAYLRRFPDDADARRALQAVPLAVAADPGATARQEGFARLEAGAGRDAARQFEAAIAANPQDADALGGLGVVRLREGRNAEARQLLERAVAADPRRGAQWQSALDGAAYGLELAEGRAALRRGAVDQADEIARSAARRDVQDRVDAEVLLGEVALRRGDAATAEQRFRAALARRPGFAPAQQGLNQALRAQGRLAEPAPRVATAGDAPAVTGGEAGRLRAEAARSTDAGVAAALLRQAMQSAPADPWLRLDLARALRRQGRGVEARALMEEAAARGDRDSIYAAALLADEDNRPADAEALVNRIQPSARTPDMARFAQRLRSQADVQNAARQAIGRSPAQARQALTTLAARPDPTGATAAAAIRALGNAGDRFGAAEAARVAEAANRGAGNAFRLTIAGALLAAGVENDAAALLDAVENGNPTAEQRRDIAIIRGGVAIRASDRANEGGTQAQGFEALRPVLERDPENPDAQLALARLYQGARRPADALRTAEAVLARNPRSIEARQGAVDAAIALRDRTRAERLLAEAQEFHPRDSRVSLMEARIARAFSQESRALRALELADQQRRAELGRPTGTRGVMGDAVGGLQNPFARSPLPQVSAGATPADPIARAIAQESEALAVASGVLVTGSAGLRQRSGTAGLDRLVEISAPQSVEFSPPGLGGRMTAQVTAIALNGGTLSNNPQIQQRFGGNAAFGSSQTPRSSVSGITAGIAYQLGDNFRMDVGSSPFGFGTTTQVLGGVEFAPVIAGGVRLRVTGERRSVTDSMLSWAGARDSVTGRDWGQVVRMGGRAQVEVPIGAGFIYAGGGYAVFQGNNVVRNTRYEAGAGISYPVIERPDGTLTVGADLVYFGFERNLRFFSLGHGGYYSPQSFFALNLPVDYRGRSGDLSYRVGGTIGYAIWRESSAPVFPMDPVLQGAADFRATTNPDAIARYPGQSRQNMIANLRADLEYAISPRFNLAGSFRYDRSANWNETRVLVRMNGRF